MTLRSDPPENPSRGEIRLPGRRCPKGQHSAMRRYRNLIVVLLDIVILTFSDWAAMAIRFESVFPGIPVRYLNIWRAVM